MLNTPNSLASFDESSNLKIKKEWGTPNVEIIATSDIESGTIPFLYEDVLPLKTFQHS